MLMLTDSLEWWARRFQRARKKTPSEVRRTGERGDRRIGPRRDDGRFSRDEAPNSGRFARGALHER